MIVARVRHSKATGRDDANSASASRNTSSVEPQQVCRTSIESDPTAVCPAEAFTHRLLLLFASIAR
jgi:hypothetical protein